MGKCLIHPDGGEVKSSSSDFCRHCWRIGELCNDKWMSKEVWFRRDTVLFHWLFWCTLCLDRWNKQLINSHKDLWLCQLKQCLQHLYFVTEKLRCLERKQWMNWLFCGGVFVFSFLLLDYCLFLQLEDKNFGVLETFKYFVNFSNFWESKWGVKVRSLAHFYYVDIIHQQLFSCRKFD